MNNFNYAQYLETCRDEDRRYRNQRRFMLLKPAAVFSVAIVAAIVAIKKIDSDATPEEN